MIREAQVLTFRFLGGAQAEALGLKAGVWLGQFPEGEHQTPQRVLGKVVEEITLILALIQTAQELMTAVVALITMANPGVMAGRDAIDRAFAFRPGQHRTEFHLAVAP